MEARTRKIRRTSICLTNIGIKQDEVFKIIYLIYIRGMLEDDFNRKKHE